MRAGGYGQRVAVERRSGLHPLTAACTVLQWCHVPRGHGVRVRARDRQPQGHPPERAQQTISATQHAPAATTLFSFNPGPVAFISFQWLERWSRFYPAPIDVAFGCCKGVQLFENLG